MPNDYIQRLFGVFFIKKNLSHLHAHYHHFRDNSFAIRAVKIMKKKHRFK